MVKWISIGITALIVVVGSVFFLEDRYFHKEAAVEMKEELKEKTLQTFDNVQRSLKSMERDYDSKTMDSLRDRIYLLKKRFEKEPNNDLLEEKIERMQRQLEKLESKLYE